MSVAPNFRKIAKRLVVVGILEIIGGIIMFIFGIADEELFIGIGIGTVIVGLFSALVMPLFFYAIAETLEYLKSISDNIECGSNNIKEGKTATAISKPAMDDIPEI